jgi:hypothetical protein
LILPFTDPEFVFCYFCFIFFRLRLFSYPFPIFISKMTFFFFLSAITSTIIFAVIKSTNAIFLHTCIAHTLRFVNCSNITKRTYFCHMCNSIGIKNKSLSKLDIFLFYQCLEFKREPRSYLGAV